MAWTTPRSWTTGEVVTAALLDAQIKGNMDLTAPAILTTLGDILYCSAANTPSRLAKDTNATRVLTNTGTSNIPAWAQVTLTSGVTGTLPVGNGGTGITSLGSNVATFLGTPSSANLRSALTDETGTGGAVFASSPTLTTPALGTPSALVGTNISGTASSLTAGTVTTNANLTGHVTSSGNAAVLGSFTSAQLATALTNETGTGLAVFNGSPALTTPTIASFANSAHDHADAAGGAAVVSASVTVSGVAELATTAEINTGSDTGRTVTPDGLAGSVHGEKVVQMVVVDFATALTVQASGAFWFHVPSTLNGFNIVDVHAEVISAPAGSTIIIDLYNVTQSGDILSTNLTIDASETGSDTAAAAAVIDTGQDDLQTNDVIRVDIDQIGSSTAGSGLIVTLICRLP